MQQPLCISPLSSPGFEEGPLTITTPLRSIKWLLKPPWLHNSCHLCSYRETTMTDMILDRVIVTQEIEMGKLFCLI